MATDEARVKSLALWDRMAEGWDKHNEYIWEATGEVGERLVELLAPQEGQTILDIAAGPGNTGFVAAELIGDNGKLIATDFSPEMVEVARSRAAITGIANAEFKVMDAESMDLPDDSVDGIICRWGFMLMLDPAAALRETRRVLRPERARPHPRAPHQSRLRRRRHRRHARDVALRRFRGLLEFRDGARGRDRRTPGRTRR